jgi:subtilisin family serine protease
MSSYRIFPRLLTSAFLILLLWVAMAFPAAGGEGQGGEVASGRSYILKPRSGKTAETVIRLVAGGMRLEKALPGGMLLAELPQGIEESVLRDLPSVAWVEPDLTFNAAETPDDPDYPLQWNLEKINMPGAWDIAAGGRESAIVAVIDSGVAYRTAENFSRAPDFAATRFKPGYDFIAGDEYPDDEYGHGTHVAAIIASSYDNSFRAAGMAYECTIMPVRVLGSDGAGTSSTVASGIYYAVDNGAKVINLSLSSPRHSNAVEEAVKYAHERGALCVAAAGNEGSDPGYPGGMGCPADAGMYVMAVGATDYRDVRAHYSNYGEGLDLVAPGGDLTRDDNGDGYGDGVPQESYRVAGNYQSGYKLVWGEGTSMAAPQVSATAALMFSVDSRLTPCDASSIITSNCTDLGAAGWDQYYGHGMLDVAAALHDLSRSSWYFAEGTTRSGFEEWLCVLNPDEEDAHVEFTFLMAGGQTQNASFLVPGKSRFSASVNALVGPEQDVAASITSPQRIFVERAMYFDYHGNWQGGSSTMGSRHPATSWYFAEGTTRSGFEEWLTLANPGDEAALVTVEYMLGEGQGDNVIRDWEVPAHSRVTASVNEQVGPDKDVSMHVTSDQAIVAERPMYFDYQGRIPGGHNVMGASAPATSWYFAEGTTRSGFEEWLTLANPGDEAALVTVEYMLGEGQGDNVIRDWEVPAHSRVTASVNEQVGPDKDVSMHVTSDQAIVAERPMYFHYGAVSWGGGSCEIGYDAMNGAF